MFYLLIYVNVLYILPCVYSVAFFLPLIFIHTSLHTLGSLEFGTTSTWSRLGSIALHCIAWVYRFGGMWNGGMVE